MLLFAVNSLIEHTIPADKRLPPAIVDKQQATILINRGESKEEFIQDLHEMAQLIQESAENELRLPVSVGISQPFEQLAMAKTGRVGSVEIPVAS